MCLVIDINTLSCVFEKNNRRHSEFAPVFDWIFRGNGKIVIGGTKYQAELERTRKYLNIVVEFQRKGKVVTIRREDVDTEEERIRRGGIPLDFDDPHLAAIVSACGVRVVCSCDKRSYKHLKDRRYYPSGVSPPKIYSRLRNRNLLARPYYASVCDD